MSKLNKIEIWWHGPYTLDEVQEKFTDGTSYGVYQIYGTHNISGPNTLLYIGKASDQTFFRRLNQHYWAHWESSETKYYIGKLGGIINIDNDEWEKQIDITERLLVYFCAPPYNTQFLNSYGNIENTIVLNFDKKNRLPFEVSTFYEDSKFWDEDDNWKEYIIK